MTKPATRAALSALSAALTAALAAASILTPTLTHASDRAPYPGWEVPARCAQHANPAYWCHQINHYSGCCARWVPPTDPSDPSDPISNARCATPSPPLTQCYVYDQHAGCCTAYGYADPDRYDPSSPYSDSDADPTDPTDPTDHPNRCALTATAHGEGYDCNPTSAYGEATLEALDQCTEPCSEPRVVGYDEIPSYQCKSNKQWYASGAGTAYWVRVEQRCVPSYCEVGLYTGLTCHLD